MRRLLVAGTILAGTAAATSLMTSPSSIAEPGSMVLIGAGLVLTASFTRQKLRSRR